MKRLIFSEERDLREQGYCSIVGIDEVGVGPLAGPLVAAAVHLPEQFELKGLRDSKVMTEKKREEVSEWIKEKAISFAICEASVEEINTVGIRQANYLAMRRAVLEIETVDFVLVDAWTIPDLPFPQKGIVKGDSSVPSIAAASVLAKVYRDALMAEFDKMYEEYGFSSHKGYGTKRHLEAIKQHGPCEIHRTSWDIFERLK